VHTSPVPTQAKHLSNDRRSMPSAAGSGSVGNPIGILPIEVERSLEPPRPASPPAGHCGVCQLIPPLHASYSRKPAAARGGNKSEPAAVLNWGRRSLTDGRRGILMPQPYGSASGSNGRAADTLPRPIAPPEEKPHPVDEPARRAGF